MSNKPRASADPIQLRCYSVSQPLLRHWLFVNGHEDAAKALAGVEYVDLQLAWNDFCERHADGTIAPDVARRWMECVHEGEPDHGPAIIPNARLRAPA